MFSLPKKKNGKFNWGGLLIELVKAAIFFITGTQI